jgi:uncharacterized RDD family membrane protein YckC
MSTDQPGDDPFRKKEPPEEGQEPPSYGDSAGPYGAGGPYASNPYGDMTGAADPLAGMAPLASRGKRLLARIIDALLIGIPVGLIMGFAQGGLGTGDDGRAYGQQAVYTLVYLVYEGLMLTNSGQTVGKKLMRIRVAVLADGTVPRGAPGWLRPIVYHLPPLVPCVGFIFWLANVLFCTWDKPYQQCLHDKAAKTVVVATD